MGSYRFFFIHNKKRMLRELKALFYSYLRIYPCSFRNGFPDVPKLFLIELLFPNINYRCLFCFCYWKRIVSTKMPLIYKLIKASSTQCSFFNFMELLVPNSTQACGFTCKWKIMKACYYQDWINISVTNLSCFSCDSMWKSLTIWGV